MLWGAVLSRARVHSYYIRGSYIVLLSISPVPHLKEETLERLQCGSVSELPCIGRELLKKETLER